MIKPHKIVEYYMHKDGATEIPIRQWNDRFIVEDLTNGSITIHVATRLCGTLEDAKAYAIECYNEVYGEWDD